MPYSLKQIADAIGAELRGDPLCRIESVGALSDARSGQITFLANSRLSRLLPQTHASAVILTAADQPHCPTNSLVSDNPYVAYVKAAGLLHPPPGFVPGVDAGAVVHEAAEVASSAFIGPCAVVGEGARIASEVFVGPGCVICDGAEIGRGSRLVANVTLCHGVKLGERVLVHPGAVIGADGFGLANDHGAWLKIPQLGSVRIGDDVEIGANTGIDRGALGDTVIEAGVKIDNLVQIGHNVRIGAHTAIAGCAVIAGSVTIGRRCMIGGASALSGHIEIADDVVITGMSGVPNSIPEPGTWSSGMPVTDNRTWRKNMVRLKHLDRLARQVQGLERRLAELRQRLDDRD
ncbi:MAG: UDP-3-O-(3-hydroxymyristoyl)glucosamine N-acyltransferase [Gammaproteobacteria bacterium]|nr:UDP-3-O-(3-hydroxymyristoyl)glucosamine N-acyltransferase [Gammaproteobacteria bacterium]